MCAKIKNEKMTDKIIKIYGFGVSHIGILAPPESMDTGENKSYSMKMRNRWFYNEKEDASF